MALGLQTQTQAGARALVSATPNDDYLKSILAELDVLQGDSVKQEPKSKKETGMPVADTRTRQAELYQGIDDVYDSRVADVNALASGGRGTTSVYPSGQSRTEGDNTLSKNDAASVGQSQTYASTILNNPRFDNSQIGTDPDLTYDEEARMLETFAEQAGVEPEAVAANPRLYEAFGRYLGMATGTLNNEKYLAYDVNGDNLKDADGNNYKSWTPFVQPKHISQITGAGTKVKDNPYAQRFRGSKEKYVAAEMAEGVEQYVAEAAWEQQGDIDTNESLILKAGFPEDDQTVIAAAQMGGEMAKTLRSLVRSVHSSPTNTSPAAVSRFAEKLTQKRYDEFKGESVNEMISLFLYTHAALEEQSEGAAQAYAEMMMLAVFDHALRNVYRYQDKKDDPSAEGAVENETEEDAMKRFDATLMTAGADQRQIGATVLRNMGFTKTTPEQHEAMGAMAMDMVFNTFETTNGSNINSPTALFRKVINESTVDGTPRTNIGYTFTNKGIGLAQDMQGLFEVVMPSSARKVRYANLLTNKTAIEKLINQRIKDTDETVPFGDTTKAARDKQQADNTPVTVHDVSEQFWSQIYTIHQNEGPEVQDGVLSMLDDANFFNTKGNGNNAKGTFGNRLGYVYATNRSGKYYHKDSPHFANPEVPATYTANNGTSTQDAATKMDFSDKVKDQQFINTINFATSNLNRTFFYTYKYGKNWRLNVDQTEGNYQHNKFARSLIAAGVPALYSLLKVKDVVSMKAGIMKRFGMDMKNPIQAALEYDAAIDSWMAMEGDHKAILKAAANEEGFASVAAILEGIKFKKALDAPGKTTYASSFFTEIDGKTNGLAHASAQAGDKVTGSRALIFDNDDYQKWTEHYDEFEKVQNNPEALRQLEKNYDLEPGYFTSYLDAYNKVNNSLLQNFADIRAGRYQKGPKQDELVTFPGMLREGTAKKFQIIMNDAQNAGGLDKFTLALDMFGESAFGRSFTKKPVMIFAYGAGDARHIEEVRSFVDAILRENGVEFQQKLAAAGINVDRDFIEPLGVMMSEAVNTNFGQIKEFASALAAMGAEAVNQGFDLFIPTMSGHLIPIGATEYWLSKEPGDKRQQKWTLPDGETASVIQVQHMKKAWDTRAGRDIPDTSGAGNSIRIFRAATQMAVFLTHANDNINMQEGIGEMHDAKIAKRKADPKDSMSTGELTLPFGNTALHIFDGLLVTPKEAEQYADTLNDVFRRMNTDPNNSHMHALYNALTFELDANGEKIKDDNYLSDPIYDNNAKPSDKLVAHHYYKRRLTPEGALHALENDNSTWDKMYDPKRDSKGSIVSMGYAFDWNTPDRKQGKKLIRGTAYYFKKFFHSSGSLIDAKKQYSIDKTHYHQFFYSTDKVDNQLANWKDKLMLQNMTKDSSGNPRNKKQVDLEDMI